MSSSTSALKCNVPPRLITPAVKEATPGLPTGSHWDPPLIKMSTFTIGCSLSVRTNNVIPFGSVVRKTGGGVNFSESNGRRSSGCNAVGREAGSARRTGRQELTKTVKASAATR
ncbi:MAG: hypothetical protein BWY06_00946 [Candidatus Latescibacteria bacterium ADurb.Bin168]|nr:MAG: hypothetical protein BWY06_00946 [Candidatus Latescibacteria bacterium ADurb.Bin168]